METNRINKQQETVNILRVEGIMAQGYGLNPKIVMRDKRLTPEAKCIYSYIASFAGAGSQAFPGRETILEELNMSKDRYYRHLNLLIEADYIRIDQIKDDRGYFKRNVYTIVTNPNPVVKEKAEDEKRVQKKGQAKRKTAVKRKAAVQDHNVAAKAKENYAAAEIQKNTSARTRESILELRNRLQIDELKRNDSSHSKLIEEIFMAIEDMDMSEQINIGGSIKNKEAIQNLLNRLTIENVRLVTNTLASNKKSLTNRKKYIQACLANSIFDINKENDEAKLYLEQRQIQEEKEKKEAADRERYNKKLDEIYARFPELENIDSEIVSITRKKSTAILKQSHKEIDSLNERYEELEKQREKIEDKSVTFS